MASAVSAIIKTPKTAIQRLRVVIRGAVQGVGFRPFVYRLAQNLKLAGWVNNSPQGVFIEVEGERDDLIDFMLRLEREKPSRSFIQSLEPSFLDAVGYADFEIRTSDRAGDKTALVLPDIGICADCLGEIFDPSDRRYLYPFTNCTNCGPRFSIIEALPYDRRNTSMKKFHMCDRCAEEYEDPRDRRFHAQPNACPDCGPHVELWSQDGNVITRFHAAVQEAASAIRQGYTVAVKGLGGFHLMTDARNDQAVEILRRRKHREEKPLAVMMPSLEAVKAECLVDELEERLLRSPEAPIVLLRRAENRTLLSRHVAPGNPYIGAMLPYTPLHHLLMAELGFPVVATSGNESDEPICTNENDAIERLGGIADLFLVHNRPILRHVDDSIVRVVMGREMVFRRARGYAPLPVHLSSPPPPVIAVGAHLKNTIAAASGNDVFISQHIGDLETSEAFTAFERVILDFERLYELRPSIAVSDLHPAYLSTQFAEASGLPRVAIQHHFAHILSCMAENEVEGPVLGVAWDGTGYGPDGSIWGGEFLRVAGPFASDGCACKERPQESELFERVAHFRTFRLPGGEFAIKEPRRIAMGLLYELFGENAFSISNLPTSQAFDRNEAEIIKAMLRSGINSPVTSSAGRLFDAVASLIGLRQKIAYEGQAAMMLEFAMAEGRTNEHYEFGFADQRESRSGPVAIVDWGPVVLEILCDIAAGVPSSKIAARFHNAMVEAIVGVAIRVGEPKVALSGGCFQNKYLTEQTVTRLREEGFSPYWHQRVPTNDGGIALGQVIGAALQTRKEIESCAWQFLEG